MEIIIEPLPGNETAILDARALTARVNDLLPAIGAITESFRKTEQRRFDAEGPGWKPLTQFTVDAKAGAYDWLPGSVGVAPILQRSQELMRSLTTDLTIEYAATADGYYAEMGTNVPYAEYHQKGEAKYGGQHMMWGTPGGSPYPKREIVDLTPEVLALWRTILEDYIIRGVETDVEAL